MSSVSKSGFTLLEFLIYISIISTISLMLGGTFLSLNNSRGLNESRAEVNSAIKIVMDKIKDDLKNASDISVPYVGDSSSTMTILVNSESIIYSFDLVSGAVLRKAGSSDPAALNSNKVKFTAVDFEYIQNTSLPLIRSLVSVKVDVTAEYNTSDPAAVYSENRRSTFSLGKLIDIARPSGTALTSSPGTDMAGENIPKSP